MGVYERLDHVFKITNRISFFGVVVGAFETLEGERFYVVQTYGGTILHTEDDEDLRPVKRVFGTRYSHF